MSAALSSAPLAARAISRYLATGKYDAFRAYDARRRALVRNSDILAAASLALSRYHPVATLAIRNLSRRPQAFTRLVAVSSGAAPLRSLKARDIAALATGL